MKTKQGRREQKPQPRSACSVAEAGKVRFELTFRSVEYHRITRDVDAEAFAAMQRDRSDICAWLDEEFRDDPMPDSDIETTSFELDEWEIV